MKRSRKILSCLLCLCMVLSVMPINVFAARFYNTGSCGALLNDGVLTISGEGSTGDHNSYTPQPWLAQIDSIHTVIINDDVTGIGNNTFKYMRALKNVTIGKNVADFGSNAFLGCENLENIYWNATNAEDLSQNNTIFSECGTSANGITVAFGESVEYIPANLFWSTTSPKIKKVVFNGPVEIGYNAFALCGKVDVHISSVEDWCQSKFKSTDSNPLIAGSSLYLDGVKVKDLKTSNNLRGINEMAFIGCTSIETITIKDGLTKIGQYAFADCSNIKEVYLPKSLKNIGRFAFDIGNRKNLDIYYAGTEAEWNAISKDYYLDTDLVNLTMHYNEIYEKKDFEGITLEDAEYTYDGTEKSVVASGVLPEGATVEYVNNKATNVGTYDVTATVKALGYYDLSLNATLKINPKTLTVSNLIAQDKNYDGTDKAILSNASLSGKIADDDVSADIPTEGKFADENAGDNISVSIEPISLTGADKDNYALIQPSGLKANITKAPITVKANDKQIRIGDAIPVLDYAITNGELFGEDMLEGALTTNCSSTAIAKEFIISQGTLTAGSNYDLIFVEGKLTVVDKTPQNIVVDGIVTEKTYGDEGFKITVTPDENSNLDNFEITSSNTDVATVDESGNVTIKNAGSTTISVKEPGNADYAPFEKTWTLTVNKVDITVNADAKSKRIGSSDPSLTYTYTGNLVGTDAFTGELSRQSGEEIGKYDILQGTLALSDNYNITFNKAIFEIVDKTPQNITVDGIVTEKTYGDEGFKVTVTPDATSKLDNFTMTSSNTDVATIDEAGNVVIKNAGSTEISVKEAGNTDYAAFEKKWTLNVKKVAIVVTADNKFKKIGQADPEFTYTYTGELVGNDEFTGALTRKTGEEIGKYDILIGSLALTDNYTITYNKGVFEILDKTPQIIALADIDAKTYGDASFKVTATADTTSKLDVFTYESDNTNVATVDAEGNVTIIEVGKANIIVKQAGNDEYAAASASKELVVNKKNITLTDVDLINKTATFEGVLETDISAVGIDFDKIDSVVNSETSKAVVSNFVLIGDKSANYALTTKEIEKDVVISAGTITAPENVTITVQKAEGTKTVIVSTLDVSALPEETEKVELDMTENGSVDTVSVPKTAFTDLKDKADLEIKLTDGVVKLNKLALTAIEDAANSDKISLKVVKLGDEQLEEVQVTEKNKLTNPVVFGLILSGVTDSLFDGGQATVTVSYEKTGSGNVKVKYLKDDGTTEAVSARYDATNKTVTMTLSHFSDYVVYTEPKTYSGGGGGGVSSYTVKFDTNGAETIKNQSIKKNGLVTEPTMPTKDGYTFDGWYTDKELTQKYDFTTKVTKGFTLYAKWTEIEKEPVVDEPDTTITFTDVKENDWFYANVQYVVENKLMNGVAEDKFAPNDTLTRAMLVTVLYRNADEPAVNKSIPFADVDMGSWYANAVVWAKQNGIVNGVNETEFAPDANITREQIATIMFRYAQYKGMDAVTLEENLHFTDANEISEYAVSAMNWAVGTGLINGKSTTTLNPKDNATRAEIAAILQRFIEANK